MEYPLPAYKEPISLGAEFISIPDANGVHVMDRNLRRLEFADTPRTTPPELGRSLGNFTPGQRTAIMLGAGLVIAGLAAAFIARNRRR